MDTDDVEVQLHPPWAVPVPRARLLQTRGDNSAARNHPWRCKELLQLLRSRSCAQMCRCWVARDATSAAHQGLLQHHRRAWARSKCCHSSRLRSMMVSAELRLLLVAWPGASVAWPGASELGLSMGGESQPGSGELGRPRSRSGGCGSTPSFQRGLSVYHPNVKKCCCML